MEYMMDNVLILATNAVELYVVFRFMILFLDNRRVEKYVVGAVYLVRYIVTSLVMIMVPYPMLSMLTNIFSLFLITLCYRTTISKKIVTTFMIILALLMSEAMVALIIGLSDFEVLSKAGNIDGFTSISMVVFFWMITMVIGRFKSINIDMPVPNNFTVAVSTVLLVSLVLITTIFQQQLSKNIIVISLMCILLINFIMIYLYDSLSEMFVERTRGEVLKREKAYYHKQSVLLQKNQEEVQRFKHDMKNRMLVISQLAERDNVEKIQEYVKELVGELDNKNAYSQTGNVAIDSIINYKLGQAKEKGVELECYISVPQTLVLEDDDIVIILR